MTDVHRRSRSRTPAEVAGGDVGEVVARRERLPLGGEHDAGGLRPARGLERVEQLAQVLPESALRRSGRFIVIRDGVAVVLDQQVLVVGHTEHGTTRGTPPAPPVVPFP